MTTDLAPRPDAGTLLEQVLIGGDLSKLTPKERLEYYQRVCTSLGLNPLTRPLEYITLSGRLTLYARRDATDQLRTLHGISVERLEREVVEGIYVVTAYVTTRVGRKDSDLGAVTIEGLKGEARANAMLKAVTKAKRRATLSICGLGMLDEMEVETIPGAELHVVEPAPAKRADPVNRAPAPEPGAGDAEQYKLALQRFQTTDDDPEALAALWRGVGLPDVWRTLTVSQQVELGAEYNAARRRLGVR